MAIEATDLQPKEFKVTVNGKEYICKPPRLAHRIILMKVSPMFEAISDLAAGKGVDISSEKILGFQDDLDTLFDSLIPDLRKDSPQIDEAEVVLLIEQILKQTVPEEAKQLDAAKVTMGGEDGSDPKEGTTASS